MSANEAPTDLSGKQVFTTGEAAEICKVSQQTIIRCFDSGRLNGFRVPGSRFRRIPRDELLKFMQENGIPVEALGEKGSGQKRKLLVVDDDEQIVELFVDVLSRNEHYEVKTASTGYDAGIMTEQFKPDLMILDYMLPDINGNKVCETVRKNPDLVNMKIIIVSGVVNQDEVHELLQSGADEFIKKPFNIENLQERIETLLAVAA
ncbi:Transcriptional regulatory protein YycF [Poriferisphaera corsica]|uniref:Transcriptional regulatory protein YycF n=1 Tax=Poriferisphaera corsica TaxID=2528020 RepID=A0A517YYM6_9BACT|nr:response regulator [Poriferisphaera corsica]QDU35311.1 Transcriptional regulatory protein YycF [Poriferisphaera corsica]